VIRYTEEKMDLVECFDPDTSHCRIEPVCGLRGVLEEALDAFLNTLDRYTLADLVARRRTPLDRLLSVS
jgi:Rrf2 family nitric oxide-sensitive transcriptional repressor